MVFARRFVSFLFPLEDPLTRVGPPRLDGLATFKLLREGLLLPSEEVDVKRALVFDLCGILDADLMHVIRLLIFLVLSEEQRNFSRPSLRMT